MTDVYPNWGGHAKSWGNNAQAKGFTTHTDFPRLGDIVSIPPGAAPLAGAQEGHVGQIRWLKFANGRTTMQFLDMNGQVASGWSTSAYDRDWQAGMIAISAPYTIEGDLNYDGTINATDLSILLSNYNGTNWRADLNDDRTTNLTDLSMLLSYTP